MNVTISLSPEEQKKLQERASLSGDDLAGYILRIIARDLKAPDALASLLAPVRQQFEASGMSEEELDTLVQEAREEVWREKQARPSNAS
jgi:hypothetical protein